MKVILRTSAWVYAAVILVSVVGNLWVAYTTDYGVKIEGCYHDDAMLVGVICQSIPSAEMLELFLNLSFLLIYLPVVSWLPFVYLIASYLKQFWYKRC